MVAYLITNKVTGERYVGITSHSANRRWSAHCAEATNGSHRLLPSAIRRYGAHCFAVSVIATGLDADGLKRVEPLLIKQHRSRAPRGYNMTDGGEGTNGLTHSEGSILKISMASRGRRHSEATKAKMSAAHTGKRLCESHRAKMSAAHMGKKMPVRTSQHKARISAGLRRAWAAKNK